MTVDEFFSNMETMDMKMDYVAEFLRQASQLKRQGRQEYKAAMQNKKAESQPEKHVAKSKAPLPRKRQAKRLRPLAFDVRHASIDLAKSSLDGPAVLYGKGGNLVTSRRRSN